MKLEMLLVIVPLWVVGLIGWFVNIVKVVDVLDDPVTGLFVFRAIGVFVPPQGAVLEYV